MVFLAKGIEEYMLPCLNKKLFGFECLGCGLQRSIVLLFKFTCNDILRKISAVFNDDSILNDATCLPIVAIIFANSYSKVNNPF